MSTTHKFTTLADRIIAELGVFAAESQSHETHELDPIDAAALLSHIRTQANTLRSTEQELELCREAFRAEQSAHLATRRALGEATGHARITLTVEQIIAIADFYKASDEEPDSEKDIRIMAEWTDVESGEIQPAGVYVSDSEYPEHGLMGPFNPRAEVAKADAVKHNENCDALDSNPEGIVKPCNCGAVKLKSGPADLWATVQETGKDVFIESGEFGEMTAKAARFNERGKDYWVKPRADAQKGTK